MRPPKRTFCHSARAGDRARADSFASAMLDNDVTYLKGIGPRKGAVLAEHDIKTCLDLLHYFPRRYLDRTTVATIRGVRANAEAATVIGTVRVRDIVRRGRRPRLEVIIEDADGERLKGVWFHGLDWIARALRIGDRVAFYAKVQRYGGMKSMTHPDFDNLDADGPALDTGRILALYRGGTKLQRAGITSRTLRRTIYELFRSRGKELSDNLPAWIREDHELMDGRVALRAIHFPKSHEELDRARHRLKFEEFFFLQLMLALNRQRLRKREGTVLSGPGETYGKFLEEVLPFSLTRGQEGALAAVVADTGSGLQMNRLIQGDVGCGKTVVAVAALLLAVDNGYQGAFMAPTEILAEQHYSNLRRYFEPLSVEMRLLVGKQRKKQRQAILTDVAEGRAQVVVGTHAVIQEGVAFRNLAMAVVDEQHRFGVLQRAGLYAKGSRTHMLLMTATPIPRSLALTVYGDLDVTAIRDIPAGRRTVRTRLCNERQRPEMMALLRRELGAGHQAYIVYPLVEESGKLDLKDAETGLESLRKELPDFAVELVHGRMRRAEKEAVMERFKLGQIAVLVATTVIEVGVDVPRATVMVIEHAERFGLSQLHQLRGRVGRGPDQSYCVLMADYRRTREADQRLTAMLQTTDGFEISEWDMKLRGAGDIVGTRQSGLPEFKIADIVEDQEILQAARGAATDLVRRDGALRAPEHAGLRRFYLDHYSKGEGSFFRIG